jgi:hypothetical protein
MTTYSDPENIQDIVKDIIKSKTIKDVNDLLEKIFPDFVVNALVGYSRDYPHLDVNWRAMCDTLKVSKAQIILTQDYPEDDKHVLVKAFCEILTQSGFIVRKHSEFIPCSVCSLALPSENLYTKMKEGKVPCPAIWSSKCSDC